ncbi:MAG: polyketide cyclase [Candidatus Rokuibacteriota bacterium]|nr:MAG: polyketide cyclase [Candidatus Rokubacteria bacterium]
MILKVLVGLAALVVLVVGVVAVVVALQPSEFRITRSATIAAPVAAVFAQVNDFHNWAGWSPWAKLDPSAKNTFEEAPAGTGAVFAWAGNSTVGEGRMTITESRSGELVRIKLEFVRPFVAINTAEFTFKPEDGRTVVTWSMFGHNNFIGKAVYLFVNMDKALGGEFEKGLAGMGSMAEAAAKTRGSITMRFMVQVRADKNTEAGVMPSEKAGRSKG